MSVRWPRVGTAHQALGPFARPSRYATASARFAVLLALLTAMAACGGTTGAKATGARPSSSSTHTTATSPASPTKTPGGTAGHSLQKVTLQLAWVISGFHAPFVLAKAKGYYRQAGLDVSIVQGRGAGIAIDRVARGGPIFSAIAVSAVPRAISKGAPVKVVATYLHKSEMAFIYHGGVTFNTPRDLAGKTVVISPGAISEELLPAVLTKYGMKLGQLHVDSVSPRVNTAVFEKNRDNVQVGQIGSSYAKAVTLNPNVKYKLFADFGVNLYDVGLITNNALIKQHPGLVRRFVQASSKGWAAARANPQSAVAAVANEFPNAKAAAISRSLKLILPLMNTASTAGHPLGWMSPSDWAAQLQIEHKYLGMKAVKPAADYYTNAFVGGS